MPLTSAAGGKPQHPAVRAAATCDAHALCLVGSNSSVSFFEGCGYGLNLPGNAHTTSASCVRAALAVGLLSFLVISQTKEIPAASLYLEIGCSGSGQDGSEAAVLDD